MFLVLPSYLNWTKTRLVSFQSSCFLYLLGLLKEIICKQLEGDNCIYTFLCFQVSDLSHITFVTMVRTLQALTTTYLKYLIFLSLPVMVWEVG